MWALYLMWAVKCFASGLLLFRRWLGSAVPGKVAQHGLQDHTTGSELQHVCVQLPLYREKEQVDALLASVSKLAWPRDRLEIQVLDDSDDGTTARVEAAIERIKLEQPDLNVRLLRRPDRSGYKAGALNAGLKLTDAQFFCIFDADFRPEPDFLQRTMPCFAADKRLGAVQVAWKFRNANQNLLTRMQAAILGAHFAFDQAGRSARGLFLNFNGTAGVWRRATLEDIGLWSHQTVTEDLHLSYDAMLAGWHVREVPQYYCDSELPQNLTAYLVQQRRWAKGTGQVMRLMLPRLLGYKHASTTPSALVTHTQPTHRVGPFWMHLSAVSYLFGYFSAAILLLGYVSVPFWLLQYLEAANQGTTMLLESLIWACFLTSFALVFGSRRCFAGQAEPLWSRMWTCVVLFFCAPLLGLLIQPSFWRGLCARPGQAKQLVFHKTPKGGQRTSLSRREWSGCLSLGLFSLSLSAMSLVNEGYGVALMFGIQAALFCVVALSGKSLPISELEAR